MTHDSDLLIVGGGLNGPTLALAAAQAGLSSTVIDALPEPTRKNAAFDGRAYALALASVRLLQNLGIWDRVAEHAQPMLEIKVSDGRAGEGPSPFFLHFDHAEIEEGPMGHMLEDRYLRRALIEAMAEQPLITQVSNDTVTAQESDATGVTVTLASGKTLTGRLLIGADGRSSSTAGRAGIRRTGWGYGQTALVAAIEHELPHHGIAHQFFMPPGPLAILPLPGNVSSIVWSETDATAARFAALPDDEFMEVLRPRFGDFLGAIKLRGARYTYPLSLTVANSFVADRLALIGDAAHGMHPIAGQGLNAGLRDVAALAQVMTEAARRGEDIAAPDVLARYQQWRRFDTATLAMATDLTNRLFSNDNPLLRAARDLGMGALGHMPRLRRGFIREAAGLTGDLPELMKG
ncbi:2-octaprenyl-6-methoxyphenol hydroxylase/2-octaprenyl-3-methyl-6-methoxy-1,4-benzoquinol hydroxylase [Roseovarius mucosus DSM 17069]|uniref:2-octaprenyl-6-methoxyphenol hydroxylase/2-octaprenyl-3-methyl-6-methoxy-1, 4-benzoquinol hydroxylase n=1 Tax=Roseovarius mucosus DSM 17069 TaxID=1288298 RepID=A0A0A0HLL0_9RHOB|nr:FAD-dependent monooxygenase [Roseovarius mucosus]KGM87549.1 2-octaprenyl-6-methoxyphenol hydroxylase/2-octaprenyl-3-methyl-6-methoxy-1,4-benzoquinol hydroxylase [Roseovarius mucosus DSM 17069]